jgi:hypothetical protein
MRVLFRLAPLLAALALLTLSARSVVAGEPIRSASEFDYPPFSIVTRDNHADGFAVEMLRESLRAMGREVEFTIGPWHKIKQDLADGRIQVLPLVARTLERQAHYDFTAPYLNPSTAPSSSARAIRAHSPESVRLAATRSSS